MKQWGDGRSPVTQPNSTRLLPMFLVLPLGFSTSDLQRNKHMGEDAVITRLLPVT